MALPHSITTKAFSDDQEFDYFAEVWNTALTVPSAGVGYALFDIIYEDPIGTIAAGQQAIEDILQDKGLTRSVLGYTGTACEYNSGVIPMVYHYWGAGAPPGGGSARRVITKYFGYVKRAGTVTLVMAGLGEVRAYQNGTMLAEGPVNEPIVDISWESSTTEATIESRAGYQIVQVTAAAGDLLEIYYIQDYEDWGGFGVKVLPGTAAYYTGDWETFAAALRDAPPLAASWLGVEAGGADLPASTVGYLTDARIRAEIGGPTELELKVAISNPTDVEGYEVKSVDGQEYLVDNADPTNVIRKGNLVRLTGKLLSVDGLSDEAYHRFVGNIIDIQPDDDRLTAVLVCRDFGNRLQQTFDETYPDRLSYQLNAFLRREWKIEPVWPIPAFDAWPFEEAMSDLAYRAGIDPHVLGRATLPTDPNYARRQMRTVTTNTLHVGRPLFYARQLSDSSKKMYLRRNANYGNTGILAKDYLPEDDEYIHDSTLAQKLWDRTSDLAEHYGYDFRFNSSGLAVLGTRNNPTSFVFFNDVVDYETCTGTTPTDTTPGSATMVGVGTVSVNADGVAGTLAPPSGLTAAWVRENAFAHAVALSWTNGTPTASTQIIRNGSVVHTAAAGETSFSDAGVSAGLTYTYSVRHTEAGAFSGTNAFGAVYVGPPALPNLSVVDGGADYTASGTLDALAWTWDDGQAQQDPAQSVEIRDRNISTAAVSYTNRGTATADAQLDWSRVVTHGQDPAHSIEVQARRVVTSFGGTIDYGEWATHTIPGEIVSGGTVSIEEAFNSKALTNQLAGSWAYTADWATTGYVGIVSSGGPVSSPNALRWTWPSGKSGGDAPGRAVIETAGMHFGEYTIEVWVRWSTPWTNHPSGVNKIVYWGELAAKLDGRATSQFYLNRRGNVIDMTLQWGQSYAEQPGGPDSQRNVPNSFVGETRLASTSVNDGLWHHIVLKANQSTGGLPNGRVRVWVDGILQFDISNIRWAPTGDARFYGINLDPVWGGDGANKPQTEWIELDHIRVSGS